MKRYKIITLIICLALGSWIAADLGVRDNADYVSFPIRLPLDSAGIPVTPDSFHVAVYCDTCLEPAYVARATSAFTDIGIDTVTLWGKLHWWYHFPVNTVDSNKGNVGYSVDIMGWTKKLPTQTTFSFQEADTGMAAAVANVKLATTYSKAAQDTLQNQDDWVATQTSIAELLDSIIAARDSAHAAVVAALLAMDSAHAAHVAALLAVDSAHAAHLAALLCSGVDSSSAPTLFDRIYGAYAEAKRAAESLDVAATAGDVATTLADTMIARGYAGGADSTNSATLFNRIWAAYQAALAARDSAHAAVLKAILAADSAHAANLTAYKAGDSGHAANLTAYKAADSGHAAVVAANAARVETRDSAHAAVVAAYRARDSAHAAVLAAFVARDSAHAAVLAGLLARDSAAAAHLSALLAIDSAHAAVLMAIAARDSAHAAVIAALTTPGDSTKSPTLFQRIFGIFSMAKDARDTSSEAHKAALSVPGDSTKSPTLFDRIFGAYSMAKNGRDSAHTAALAAFAARDTAHAGNVAIGVMRAYLDSLTYWSGYRLTIRSETNYDADEDTLILYKGVDTLGFEVFYHPSGTAGQAPDSTKFWPVDSLR